MSFKLHWTQQSWIILAVLDIYVTLVYKLLEQQQSVLWFDEILSDPKFYDIYQTKKMQNKKITQ